MNPELEAICNQSEEQAKDWLRNSREAHRGFPGGDMLKISETLAKTFRLLLPRKKFASSWL
jgi:hypothetical protein